MSDNLRLKGFDFVDWRIICYRCGETVDHLLLHCEKAHWLWSCVLNLLGFHGSYQERFQVCFLVGGIGWKGTSLTFGI